MRTCRTQALRHPAPLREHACHGGRHKTPQRSQDLAALGVTPEALAQTPLCHGLPDLRSTTRLFGCLDVIEGATLGGQVVTRHLRASLALTPSPAAHF